VGQCQDPKLIKNCASGSYQSNLCGSSNPWKCCPASQADLNAANAAQIAGNSSADPQSKTSVPDSPCGGSTPGVVNTPITSVADASNTKYSVNSQPSQTDIDSIPVPDCTPAQKVNTEGRWKGKPFIMGRFKPPFGTQDCIVVSDMCPKAAQMLYTAYKRDGVRIGCRDSFRYWGDQVNMRKINCNIKMEPERCDPKNDKYLNHIMNDGSRDGFHPITAKPGTSNHELGEALDLMCGHNPPGNQVIEGGVCFEWLAKYAKDFGYYNYKPENWHWSRTGN